MDEIETNSGVKNIQDPDDHFVVHQDIQLDLIMLRDSVSNLRWICFGWATAFVLHVLVEFFK